MISDYFFPMDYVYDPEEVANAAPCWFTTAASIKTKWPYFLWLAIRSQVRCYPSEYGDYNEIDYHDPKIRKFVSCVLGACFVGNEFPRKYFLLKHYCKKYNLPESLFNISEKDTTNMLEKSYSSFYVGVMPGRDGALYLIADYDDLQLKTNFIFL